MSAMPVSECACGARADGRARRRRPDCDRCRMDAARRGIRTPPQRPPRGRRPGSDRTAMNATVTQVKTTDNMAGLIRHDAHYFCARTIDGQRALLEQSYRLRYQVYCLERKFLPRRGLSGRPGDRRVRSPCRPHRRDRLARRARRHGARRCARASWGCRCFEHCTIFPHETDFTPENPRLVEVGRLSVSRSYRRRRSDDSGDRRRSADAPAGAGYAGHDRRRPARRRIPDPAEGAVSGDEARRRDPLAGGDREVAAAHAGAARLPVPTDRS